MALDATLLSATANSWVTLAESLAYFGDRADAEDFTGALTPAQEKFLVTSCLRLNQEEYVGSRQTAAQSLKWPRHEAYNFLNDEYTPPGTVPSQMKRAQIELALHLSKNDDALDEDELKQFSSMALPGGLRFELREQRSSGDLPAHVQRELRGLWVSAPGLLLRS